MSKKKRTNPNRIPLAKQHAFTAIKHQSVDIAMAIIFQAALDSGLVTPEQLKGELWPKVEHLSESITQGRVNVHDMIRCMRSEYGIFI
jgi:hypothetical protein